MPIHVLLGLNLLMLMLFAGAATQTSERFILVKKLMSWTEANTYCMTNYTSLARVRDKLENEKLQEIKLGNQVWIGLDGNSWKWSDGSESSFRFWEPDEPNLNEVSDCVLFHIADTPGMRNLDCSRIHPFLCYEGKRFSCT
uniref:C-type lectin domain-containing protein n=1 Tax=Myripristis murdjan TaxID=586833 RepID=A0A667WEQ3_9TELE